MWRLALLPTPGRGEGVKARVFVSESLQWGERLSLRLWGASPFKERKRHMKGKCQRPGGWRDCTLGSSEEGGVVGDLPRCRDAQ